MILHVQKHPDHHTLARCTEQPDGTPAPEGWEAMTVEAFTAWRDAELAAGWSPPPVPPPPPQVPWAISNADLRRQLALRDIDPESITAYLKSLPPGRQRNLALADWEYANFFRRDHALLDQLAPSFGLSAADVDAMFLACEPYPRS